MKRITLLVASAMVLLAGCASENPGGQHAVADSSYTPLGTYIPRKAPSRADNVVIIDKQALENDRTNGNGTINIPQK
jgi:hypothetical protein